MVVDHVDYSFNSGEMTFSLDKAIFRNMDWYFKKKQWFEVKNID